VCIDECAVTSIGLRIRNCPWEPSQHHAHKNDSHTPYVCLPGVIGVRIQHLRRQIWVTANDAGRHRMCFARVMEDGSGAKVDQFNNIRRSHNAVIKFEVSVSEADGVQIFDAIAYLAEYAVDLRSTHLATHDDAEEVKGGILHDLPECQFVPRTEASAALPRNNDHGRKRYPQSR
jgi:hypothetical protein